MTVTAPSPVRSGKWLEDPGFGVYVHVPFCRQHSHYSDSNSYEGQHDLHDAYVEAVIADINRFRGQGGRATSVFFGGGTPTLLTSRALERILAAAADRFGLVTDAEITVEADPETVDQAYFEALVGAGFNRVSIPVESLADRVLLGLGGTHSAGSALDTLAVARRAGFDDVNVDLVYGSPWESDADWLATLEGVIGAEPDHVSADALTVEEDTPLHSLVAAGRVPDVDPDVQAERHAVAEEVLGAAGYERYEISTWASSGRASRHQLLYWCAGNYMGFGAGAHSHVDGRRAWAVRKPRDFIDAVHVGAPVEEDSETLTADERAGEALMLGLRLKSGVKLDAFARRFGSDPLVNRGVVMASLFDAELLERDEGWLRLAPTATMVANDVFCRLL